ncbi:carboxylate-amine ligase [Pseudoroseicyclus tamaricis]|uniref:Putative glutamate--cysteine ligase 2 n=1 Tax=Pseudoroseicyclus tamaricis TaxID=2705421 RepID=A0A6B2JR49_9RHOB|nr:carboxylate-amine ligase [Pseudoroseicyclus tamaricis]NDV00465.1 carboxylate-amine ligase [Pseudoroseicyclus tamaricis]
MMQPDFTIGIEEEYLLVDTETFALADAPPGLMEECSQALHEGQVSPEFLRCQIEIGTRVCKTIPEARDELRQLRALVRDRAAAHGLAPIAASCHPFADWRDQETTDKQRYHELQDDLAGVVRRALICGMHVHVGLNDDALRADLLGQMAYFLPHLLALSTSSPFWKGEDTGLSSYRLSIFDNLPRTGLPPHIDTWAEYRRAVDVLIELDVIEDSSKIWWDLRPSHTYPTLESRICDVCPRLEDALSIAALTQCLMRMLWRLRVRNQRWRRYDNFLIAENRWRAQRFGIKGELIDFGQGVITPMPVLLEHIIELVREDAEELGCLAEVEGARNIIRSGTGAERQRAVRAEAEEQGKSREEQMRAVVAHLVEEFSADL